jgi:hypothetical protein
LADEIRRRQAAEQQAFEAHAARQRHVMAQRMLKQIVKPGKANNAWKSDKDKDKETRQASGGE